MTEHRYGSLRATLGLALVTAAAGCATTTHEAVGVVPPASASSPAAAPTIANAVAEPAPASTPAEATPAAEPASAPPPSPAPVTPVREGAWRVGAGSSFFLQSSDLGQADQTTLGLNATAGKMVSDEFMVEGLIGYSYTKIDPNSGSDFSASTFDLGAGLRYYFRMDGSTRPFVRGEAGWTFVSNDSGNIDESDNAPFLGIGGGAETFFTEAIALEYRVNLQQAFDLNGEDATDIGLFVGLSIWF